MARVNKLLIAILLLFTSALAMAQSMEIAYPLITNYTDQDYNSRPGNYTAIQDHRGIMYFGNDKGLLEFDGVKWTLISLPSDPAVRSLAVDNNGKVFVGADEEFGYLAPDSTSQMAYHSLSSTVKHDKQIGSILGTFATDNGVYFVSLARLYYYSDGKVTEIELGKALLRQPGFEVNGVVYLNRTDMGLTKVENNKLVPVAGTEKLVNESLQFILPYGEKGLLIGTRYVGLHIFTGTSLTVFKTEAEKYLADNIISSAVNLPDGNIAISTVQGGVVVINTKGGVEHVITKESGLVENSLNGLYVDKQQGLWVAADNSISRIELSSPATYFKSNSGLQGNVKIIVRHEGMLYASTAQGIYFLKNPDKGGDFIKGYQSSFKELGGFRTEYHDMISVGRSLLLATADGLYDLHDNLPIKIVSDVSNIIYHSPEHKDLAFVALQDSLISIEFVGNHWERNGLLKGMKISVTSMVQTGNDLWCAVQGKGIYRINLDAVGKFVKRVDSFSVAQGLPQSKTMNLSALKNQLLVATDQGLYQYDIDASKFVISNIFNNGFKSRLLSIHDMADGKYFIVTDKDKGIATSDDKGHLAYSTDFFSKVADASYTSVLIENGGIIWLGGSKGIIRIDTKALNKTSKDFTAILRKVQVNNGRILFDGAAISSKQPIQLSYGDNALRFEFSSSNYDLKEFTEYQYMLEGFDKNWLPWTTETREDYTNLPEGKYTFRVRARNAYGQVSQEDAYPITIHPPWYRTWWAYGLDVLVLTLLGYLVVGVRSRQLQREKKKLQELVDERTKELRESQDRLVEQQKLASLGQLTAGIAHEIKNPLNFVNNFAELSDELLAELGEDIEKNKANIAEKDYKNIDSILADLRHNAQKINEHGKRADNIVKGMLMHSRQQTGEKEPLDLNAMVEENVNLAYRGLRGKNALITVNFEKHLDPSIGNIMLIKQDLSRVFLNIANNAIYAAYKKKEQLGDSFNPVVTITTRNLSATKAEVRIRDNGTGISKENLEKIFNPFFTTKPTGEGTGLGLSISYDIVVKGHGGELKAESKEGEYTEFIITLSKN